MNMNEVDLRQVRCLVAVAEEGTFTDAAIRLGTSQPAVSRAIARLEDALDARLIERTTRSVALTPAGQVFYNRSVEALAAIDEAIDAVRGDTRPLRVGYAWAAFGRHTSTILRRWRQEFPPVALEVHRIDERDAALTKGRVDVAVIRGPFQADGLHIELLFTEMRLGALPAGHSLAGRAHLAIDELRGPIVLNPSVGTTTLELWPADVRPTSSLEVDNVDEWLTVIASGAAMGVTAEATAFQHPHPGIVFVPLPDVARIPVQLAWPERRPHPSVVEFADLVRRCVANPSVD
jgi:DNA-binding transcriptional LysR family regulator